MLAFWNDGHRELRERATEVARALEHAADPRAVVRQLGETVAPYIATSAYGGPLPEVDATSLCIIREALAERSAFVDSLFAVQGLASYPITLAGSDEQKRHYVAPTALGRRLAAFALTEPTAGSDPAALRTVARREGGDYVLDGEKTLISNAGLADYYIVFAKTAPDEAARGISAFVVDASTAGFAVSRTLTLLSDHPIGELTFERCRVPASARLGAEGEGLKIALGTLDRYRVTVGAAACGLARRALDEAVGRVRSRQQFGQALAEFEGIRFMLADCATELEAARLLVFSAAHAVDRGLRATRETSMAKLYATESAQRVVDVSLQLHGGAGLVAGTPTERLYRDVRALRIYEGTSEIQRLIIARDLLR
jgi:acyl-CoA dehydrogenase